MKTLVIHPKDSTTDFLSEIYSDKNWTLVNTRITKKLLKTLINEHDRIVMLGHGTESGLIGFGRAFINSDLVYLLREKLCVCIWCNADVFVNKYNLKGFYTGMIISDYEEAMTFGVPTNLELLDESNLYFAKAIKDSIDSTDFLSSVKKLYEGVSAVIEFNKENLYYKHYDSI